MQKGAASSIIGVVPGRSSGREREMRSMQDLVRQLNRSGKKLSKGHRKIAEYIETHYDKAVFMTANRLGECVGVSESTVVRFASALGYAGYPQLQRALQLIGVDLRDHVIVAGCEYLSMRESGMLR